MTVRRVKDFSVGDRIEIFDKNFMEWVAAEVDQVDEVSRSMIAIPEDHRIQPGTQNLPLVYGISEFLLDGLVRGPLP